MPLDSWLAHTCKVERSFNTTDAYQLTQENFAVVVEFQRCRLVAQSRRRTQADMIEGMIVSGWALLLPIGADVKMGDRISNVIFEDGSVDAGPFVILSVLPRRSFSHAHTSAQLQRIGQ